MVISWYSIFALAIQAIGPAHKPESAPVTAVNLKIQKSKEKNERAEVLVLAFPERTYAICLRHKMVNAIGASII